MKRVALKLVVFPLVGAIINVAIAWLGSLEWSDSPWDLHRTDGGSLRTGSNEWLIFNRTFGMMFTEVTWSANPQGPGSDLLFSQWLRRPPWWSSIVALPGYQHPNNEGFQPRQQNLEAGFGFPVVSMLWAGRTTGREPAVSTSVIQLKNRQYKVGVYQIQVPRLLPLHVVWPGFALDSAFYAAILYLVFGGPWSAVQRRIRACRGRCVMCGYDTRHRAASPGICPECGHGSPEKLNRHGRTISWIGVLARCLVVLAIVCGAVLAYAWPITGNRQPPSWALNVSDPLAFSPEKASAADTSFVLFSDEEIQSMTLEQAESALRRLSEAVKASQSQTASQQKRLNHEVTLVVTRLRTLRGKSK